MRSAADFLEDWETQIPGTLNACTGTALPLHLRSAVCRSTQFTTSDNNNVVSQRGWRSAGCVVGVDWLKVWVLLVVRERDGDYRDVQLNRLFVIWFQMNP